jgi:hypothetical protein
MRGVPRDFEFEQPRRAEDDLLQILGGIIIEPVDEAEAGAQRRGNHARAGGRADEGEARQVEPDAARIGALVDDDVEAEILHRRVEILLDVFVEAVDFVDEEDVALLQRGEESGEVACLFDDGAGRRGDVRAHRPGDDVGERRFAEAGRPAEEEMFERVVALLRGGDENVEPLLDPQLADELVEQRGPQRHLDARVGRVRVEGGFGGHVSPY